MADERLPHPFHVFFDGDEEKYCIFAPAGCVLVGGNAVEIADVDSNGNVELDLDPEDMPDALYAHVTKDTSATGGYSVTFDGNATLSGAAWDFIVTRFGAADFDGNQYDVATSLVSIGGAGGVPGNFEPVFEPDATDDNTVKLARVGEGFCPFGRVFIDDVSPTVNASAKIATGIIYLYVTHPTSSSGTPTFEVRGASPTATQPDFASTSDKEHSLIPLYRIEDGAMTVDYRSVMSLTMREG